jgi:hypothetical protein
MDLVVSLGWCLAWKTIHALCVCLSFLLRINGCGCTQKALQTTQCVDGADLVDLQDIHGCIRDGGAGLIQ